jgi:hypothetical protein
MYSTGIFDGNICCTAGDAAIAAERREPGAADRKE